MRYTVSHGQTSPRTNTRMSTVDQIKGRLSIEDVVAQYVKLTPAGANMKARCPFHNERTPSFMISPARQTYHCFGCGVGGDMFTFIQEIEGLDFKGALKLLADKAGVEITYEPREDRDEKDELYALMEAATVFFEKQFADHTAAQKYMDERGVTQKTRTAFRIGFAPDAWDALLTHLRAQGFSDARIEAAGLSKRGERANRYYDRFRSRIMFPIADSAGRVVAFSGRIFSSEQQKSTKGEGEVAKYINSPETPLYHKSRLLYGYDRARQSIRKLDFAILVEGQMDLLATHQAGYTNTVALSGTALTPEHITLLSRMSHNLVIALDADDAGVASAGKSARAALRAGFDVKIAELPEGSDPADILAAGDADVWRDVIKNAGHVIEFLLARYRRRAADERAFKRAVEKHVLPFLADITSEIDKTHFIQLVAARLKVSEEVVRTALADVARNEDSFVTSAADSAHKRTTAPDAQETLIQLLKWQKQLPKPAVDVANVEAQLEELLTPVGVSALQEKLKDDTHAAFRFEALFGDAESVQHATEELLIRLKKELLTAALQQAIEQLRQAESEGDTARVAQYQKDCQDLHTQLRDLQDAGVEN